MSDNWEYPWTTFLMSLSNANPTHFPFFSSSACIIPCLRLAKSQLLPNLGSHNPRMLDLITSFIVFIFNLVPIFYYYFILCKQLLNNGPVIPLTHVKPYRASGSIQSAWSHFAPLFFLFILWKIAGWWSADNFR